MNHKYIFNKTFYFNITYLDLENAKSIHPGDKTTERSLAGTRHSDQEQMALGLTEYSVNT